MSVKLCDNSKVSGFDFFYFFFTVFYMAQMTPETSRMIGGLSAPWIPFLLPLVLTAVLAIRHNVYFLDKKFLGVMLVCFVWEVAVTVHKHLYSLSDQSFQFFLFYTLTFAYIHVRSFGKQIVPMYESVIVTLCKASLPFWIVAVVLPGPMNHIASFFPDTGLGNNILYLFNYIDPAKADVDQHFRNSGCSWEPGRFAIMITLGILCNLLRNGVKFKGNYNVLWMIVTLLSTMSTTGYSIVILMYGITILSKSRPVAKLGYSLILIPLVAYLFSLDFMGAKIKGQLDVEASVEERMDNMDYYQKEFGEDEYVASFGRFESMYFEWLNFKNDPILGYGRNEKHSFFRQNNAYFSLTGGVVKVFGMYGLFLGLFFYVILFRSSRRIKNLFGDGTTGGMVFLVLLLSSVSYVVLTIPIFTAFWMFDVFEDKTLEEYEEDGPETESVEESCN